MVEERWYEPASGMSMTDRLRRPLISHAPEGAIADPALARELVDDRSDALLRITKLEAALAAIHATSRRVTHESEWYLDGVRQSPGTYVVMRVGDAPGAPEQPF